jgi:hypothetical protein
MPRWLTEVLRRIHALAGSGAVRLTYKAETELVAIGLSLEDVRELLVASSSPDLTGKPSTSRSCFAKVALSCPSTKRMLVHDEGE